ncbi:hypothetical protein KI387_029827, partial [Taxus chinensis]
TRLGHIIWKEGLLLDLAKVGVIVGLGEPTNMSVIHGFLGHTWYYQNFIKGYAKITLSLDELLKHKSAFHWGEVQYTTFNTLKDRL